MGLSHVSGSCHATHFLHGKFRPIFFDEGIQVFGKVKSMVVGIVGQIELKY
jgi:hypothetical protein